jgi:RNA polymerase sigma factor (sigma-70 family)
MGRWDREVCERLVAGDEAALGELYEERAVAGSVAKSVRVALDALPAAQREAIRLAYFDGQTYRQVAATLGIPEGTAKSRLWHGLRGLAVRLRAEGIDT